MNPFLGPHVIKFPKAAPRPIAKETQSDINTQPTKINSDTENKRNELSSENVDNVEIREVGPHSSLTEGPQEIDTQNNNDSESKDESTSEDSNLDKTE